MPAVGRHWNNDELEKAASLLLEDISFEQWLELSYDSLSRFCARIGELRLKKHWKHEQLPTWSGEEIGHEALIDVATTPREESSLKQFCRELREETSSGEIARKLAGFLTATIRNKTIQRIRWTMAAKRNSLQISDTPINGPGLAETLEAKNGDPVQRAIETEFLGEVRKALDMAHCAVLDLILEGYPPKYIAQELGVSLRSVRRYVKTIKNTVKSADEGTA